MVQQQQQQQQQRNKRRSIVRSNLHFRALLLHSHLQLALVAVCGYRFAPTGTLDLRHVPVHSLRARDEC